MFVNPGSYRVQQQTIRYKKAHRVSVISLAPACQQWKESSNGVSRLTRTCSADRAGFTFVRTFFLWWRIINGGEKNGNHGGMVKGCKTNFRK